MPLYDYSCAQCGPFREWRSMSESSKPASCPDCGLKSKRFMTAPFVADMHPHSRIAHQRNEKSAHEPKVVSRPTGESAGGHSHSHSHGRHHGHSHGPSRPWMIGH